LIQRPDNNIRLNNEAVLGTVRASTSTSDSDRWATGPRGPGGLRPAGSPLGYRQTRASTRRVTERMAARVRKQQPLLPALLERIEAERDRLFDLVVAAAAAELDQAFAH
jgi:hypothetical protein